MPASFPTIVKVFTTKRNNIDIYDASHMNDVQNEVMAIETQLGVSGNGNLDSINWKLGGILTGDRAVPSTGSGQWLYKKTLVRPRFLPEILGNPPIAGNVVHDISTNTLKHGNGSAWVDLSAGPTPPTSYTPSAGGTVTLNLALCRKHRITMPAGNITIAISNATVGDIFEVAITQDGVGSRTATWFSTIKWAGGTPPTLTTTLSKRDTFVFEVTGAGTYDGFVVGQNV